MGRQRMSRRILAICTTIAVVVPITALAVADAATTSAAKKPSAEKVVLFAADGMRPDLVDKYAARGRVAHDERSDP